MYPFLHAEKQQQLLSFVQRFYIRKLKRAGNILSSLWFVQPYQLIILYLVVKYKLGIMEVKGFLPTKNLKFLYNSLAVLVRHGQAQKCFWLNPSNKSLRNFKNSYLTKFSTNQLTIDDNGIWA